MKIFSLICFILFFNYNYFNNNGDPFDYIRSDIIIIKDLDFLMNKINQEDKIIIVFSYINNYFGDTEFDFYNMAMIYSDLKKQFIYNKNIEFYRAHMCSGISPLLLELSAPSMQIYYQGKKIKSISGKKDKSTLLRAIINALKSNLNKNILKEVYEDLKKFNLENLSLNDLEIIE